MVFIMGNPVIKVHSRGQSTGRKHKTRIMHDQKEKHEHKSKAQKQQEIVARLVTIQMHNKTEIMK